MTQSIQAGFDFGSRFGKPMTVDFAGPIATSDGGLRRLKQTETKLNLLPRLSRCFRDARDPTRAYHSVAELLAQRLLTSPWARPFVTIPTAYGRTGTGFGGSAGSMEPRPARGGHGGFLLRARGHGESDIAACRPGACGTVTGATPPRQDCLDRRSNFLSQ